MRTATQRTLGLAAVLAALSAAGCTTPKAQAAIAQELNDAANAIDGLRSDVGQLQNDLDSLRTVVAKQDSILNRLQAAIPR